MLDTDRFKLTFVLITKWNYYAEKIFLYKESEVLGKNLFSTLRIKDENNQLDLIISEFKKNKK